MTEQVWPMEKSTKCTAKINSLRSQKSKTGFIDSRFIPAYIFSRF
jgi:hypothetical protein